MMSSFGLSLSRFFCRGTDPVLSVWTQRVLVHQSSFLTGGVHTRVQTRLMTCMNNSGRGGGVQALRTPGSVPEVLFVSSCFKDVLLKTCWTPRHETCPLLDV